MASPGRRWVWNHGKIWKKMSELPVYPYLSLATEIVFRFAESKSELISGALSSAVKFCLMISSVFCFFCNSCFSRTVAACSDSRFSILFWILLELGILVTPRSWSSFFSESWSWYSAWCGMLLDFLQICNLQSLFGRAGKNHSKRKIASTCSKSSNVR